MYHRSFFITIALSTQEILENFDSTARSYGETTKCPALFQPSLVDTEFAVNGNTLLRHSSSYFVTYEIGRKKLYDVRPHYAYTDSSVVTTAYDTLAEDQNTIYVDSVLLLDMVSFQIESENEIIPNYISSNIHCRFFD